MSVNLERVPLVLYGHVDWRLACQVYLRHIDANVDVVEPRQSFDYADGLADDANGVVDFAVYLDLQK